MVPFAGWEMPVEYSGISQEHNAVRTAAGLFDVSHMGEIEIAGKDALAAVQHITSNDASKLQVNQAQYSALTTPDGTFVDDLLVYRMGPSHFLLVVNAGNIDKDHAWIAEHAPQAGDVAVVNSSDRYALIAVQGPKARAIVQRLTGVDLASIKYYWFAHGEIAGVRGTISRTGYTGEDGVEVFVPPQMAARVWDALLEAGKEDGLIPCGLGARDTLRLEAGMNLYGQDMDELTQPDQAGLTWTVSLKNPERRFIGRDAIEQHATPAAFLGLKLLERGVMRSHMKVRTPLGEGEVTSGTMSPTLNVSVGFARLPAGIKPGDAVEVDIRGKWVPAQVCKLPFVRNGKPVEHA